MISRLTKVATVAAAILLVTGGAKAKDLKEVCDPKNLVKSGTFELHAASVGFLVSIHWGEGVVTLNNGESHKFHLVGGKVIETGIGESHVTGEVYNLEKLEDFEGTYYGAASESALVVGPKGGITAKNVSNCVYLHGVSSVEGVRLSPPAPGGVEIRLD